MTKGGMILETEIDCPNCCCRIQIPFMRALRAKALEDYDIAEISAREELESYIGWLKSVSLLGLMKFWYNRKRGKE